MCEYIIKEEVEDGSKINKESSCVPKYLMVEVTLEVPYCPGGKQTRLIWWPAIM